MKTKNGHILTFSEKMQISAILRFATCDWFCPMTSQIILCGCRNQRAVGLFDMLKNKLILWLNKKNQLKEYLKF